MRHGLSVNADRRLFVTGVSADTCDYEIHSYFARFGAVEHVHAKSTVSNSRAFVVTMQSSDCVQVVLKLSENLVYQGRNLHVKPFVSGYRLASMVSDMNKRRGLARKIPGFLSSEALKEWLEKYVGTVETIYQFKGKNSTRTNNLLNVNDRKKSYSILFKDQASAEMFYKIGAYAFDIKGEPSYFERFLPKKKPETNGRKITSLTNYNDNLRKVYDSVGSKHPKTCPGVQKQMNDHIVDSELKFKWSKPGSKSYLFPSQIATHEGNLRFNMNARYL